MGGVRESLFYLLSNQADYRKKIGRGYKNTFCLIEAVGLLENCNYGEGEWSGLLDFILLAICLTYIRYRVMYIAPIKNLGKSEVSMYMKESDKKKIEELWLQGYGSTKIAEKLGINVNTVKSFCRRHGLSGDRQQERFNNTDIVVKEPRCKCCGSSIAWRSGTTEGTDRLSGDASAGLKRRKAVLTV